MIKYRIVEYPRRDGPSQFYPEWFNAGILGEDNENWIKFVDLLRNNTALWFETLNEAKVFILQYKLKLRRTEPLCPIIHPYP